MTPKRPNPVLDIALTVAITLLIMTVLAYLVASVVSLLWNFVMPVLGLPTLTPLQALAFYILFKIMTAEFKRKEKITLTANLVAPNRKENPNEPDPRNKYPV